MEVAQLLQVLASVISAMNLFILSGIARRISRLEDIFINGNTNGNGMFVHRRNK